MPKCANCGREDRVLHYGGALATNAERAMCGLCFQLLDGQAEAKRRADAFAAAQKGGN